jgi:hypothetical protein
MVKYARETSALVIAENPAVDSQIVCRPRVDRRSTQRSFRR